MTTQRAEIAIPPSTNNLFATVRGRRVKTGAYKKWQKQNATALGLQLVKTRTLPVEVRIIIEGGDGFPASRDIDNIIKPTIDTLVVAGILPGDNLSRVWRVSAEYHRAEGPARCFVEIIEGV